MRGLTLACLLGLFSGGCGGITPLPPRTPAQELDQLERNAELSDRVRSDICLEMFKKAGLLSREAREALLSRADALCTVSIYWSQEANLAREEARSILAECGSAGCPERLAKAMKDAKALSIVERDRFYEVLHMLTE